MLAILENDIDVLRLNAKTVEKLKNKKITKVKQLANQTKTKLKDIGLLDYQISEVEIKLQLEGLDLKVYNQYENISGHFRIKDTNKKICIFFDMNIIQIGVQIQQ